MKLWLVPIFLMAHFAVHHGGTSATALFHFFVTVPEAINHESLNFPQKIKTALLGTLTPPGVFIKNPFFGFVTVCLQFTSVDGVERNLKPRQW